MKVQLWRSDVARQGPFDRKSRVAGLALRQRLMQFPSQRHMCR